MVGCCVLAVARVVKRATATSHVANFQISSSDKKKMRATAITLAVARVAEGRCC